MPTEHPQPKRAEALPSVPFSRILCAVDDSFAAREAIAQALTLAGHDVELTFLTVTDTRGFGPTRMATLGPHSADQALETARRAAREAGIDAVPLVRHGEDPGRVILEEARNHDLLVLGAHGQHRAAGLLLGSIPVAALHRCAVPVLIARPPRAGKTFPRDILLAGDGSPAMRPAVALAAALARRHDARVTVLTVAPVGPGDVAAEVAALTAATGVAPTVLERDGHVAGRIAEAAFELPASLVITGSRMLTGIRALGSVSERTGIVAPCSVLVLRHGT